MTTRTIILKKVGGRGPAGTGLPAGGTTGQVLKKQSNTNGDAIWQNEAGLVASVNDQIGVVVLDAEDVGADPDGSADAAEDAANEYTDTEIESVRDDLATKIDATEKGAANGVAELDESGKVPSGQLPASVDQIVEVADFASLPGTGEANKIYVTVDDDKTWRWGGSQYVEISPSIAIGETSSTAYRGDRGKTAYDHSQATSGNPHNVSKGDVGLGNADNTSDANKPVSTATQTALDGKINTSQIDTDTAMTADSDVRVPSQKAAKAYAQSVGSYIAGVLQPSIDLKENSANKSTNTSLGTSNTLFPTQNATKTYVDSVTVLKSLATTKGDLLAASAAATMTRLGVGADGTVLAADSSQATGLAWKYRSKDVNVLDYGAVADCRTVKDANMTSGSTTLTSATANFQPSDVGKLIIVGLAGAAKITLRTTIVARTNTTTVTLAAPNASGVNVVNQPAGIGTDNTTAFTNALIASRAAKSTMYIPAGDYAINGNILNETGAFPRGFRIRGDGKYSTRLYRFYDDPTIQMIFLWGTAESTNPTITATAAKGTQQLTLSSTANISAGTWLHIIDSTQPILGFDNTQNALIGEFVQVQKVDSGTQVTLTGQLVFGYGATGATAFIQRMTNGVSIEGIDFVNPTPGCQYAGTNILTLVGAENVEIKDCNITEDDNNGFSLQGCVNAKFLNLDVINTNYETTPYPILLRNGTSHVLIEGCRMLRGRHLVTTTQNVNSTSAKFVVMSNCIGWQCTNSPFDIHPAASHFTFINCVVTHANIIPPVNPRTGDITNGLGDAFQMRGPDCMIINCTVNGAFRGITMHNGAHRTKVIGCRIENCDKGIYMVNSDDVRITNTEIINPRTHGVHYDGDSMGWVTTKFYMKDVRVDGNPSTGAYIFTRWHNNFYVDRSVTAPDATVKMTGRAATTIASAATLNLPGWGDVFQVTGTTNISAMGVHQNYHGRRVTLRFAGVLTMSSGAGLAMKANLTTAAGTTLTLMSDGASWYEIARGNVGDVTLTGAETLTNKTLTNPTINGVTMGDGTNIVLNATTGTQIGTATTQKLGFYGATPVAQQATATDLGTVLANLGLRATGNYQLATAGAATLTGALRFGVQTQTANTTMIGTSSPTQLIDAASGNITTTIETAVGVLGRWHTFIRIDGSANTVTIQGTGGQTIDGAATYTLNGQWDWVSIMSDGANWVVYGKGRYSKTEIGLSNVDNTSDATKNSATATLTNKRIQKRIVTVTEDATPTINTDNGDIFNITAINQNITSMTTNLTGTPVAFEQIMISFTDDGTGRTIAWGASFESSTHVLPGSTVSGARLDVLFSWNAVTSKWRCIGVA